MSSELQRWGGGNDDKKKHLERVAHVVAGHVQRQAGVLRQNGDHLIQTQDKDETKEEHDHVNHQDQHTHK